MIKRKIVKPDSEYLLLGNMIMNNEVLSAAFNRYKSGDLKTNHFTQNFRPVFRWLVQYYGAHRKAPKRTIQKIFEARGRALGSDNRELIEEYLDRLAEEYSEYEEEATDPSFIRTEVLPDFIRERELTYRLERAQDQLDKGRIQEAEQLVTAYSKVEEEETDENIGTIMPYTKDDVTESYTSSLGETAFRFEGDLNYLIGPLCKSWLVAIMGVEKSGKSYLLQEIGYQAALYQKKKVLEINLELNDQLARNRMWRRISQTANKSNAGKMIYPILDCENNQHRTCKILKRFPNREPLFTVPGEKVFYSKNPKWKICRKCRRDGSKKFAAKTKRFIPAIWFKKTRNGIKEITIDRVNRSIHRKRFNNLKNFRVKCFPRFSVTFDEVEDYIRRYVDKTKWVPDIIIFDYLDILAPEQGGLQERIDVDRKWKKASRLAGELNCLAITADQANKAGRVAYRLDQMSTTESKTKDSHLDVRIALNQRNEEKALDIARLNVLFHRHTGFNINKEVIITQRLETAEPLMDSAFLFGQANDIKVGIQNI